MSAGRILDHVIHLANCSNSAIASAVACGKNLSANAVISPSVVQWREDDRRVFQKCVANCRNWFHCTVLRVAPGISIHDLLRRPMLTVLDLDPVRRSTAAVSAIGALRHHSLEAKFAGLAEQVRADLALFKVGDENSIRPPRKQPGEIRFSQM